MKTSLLLLIFLVLSAPALAQEQKVYDKDYNLQYRVKNGQVYDKNYNLQYRVKDNRVYDKDYNLQYRTSPENHRGSGGDHHGGTGHHGSGGHHR